MKALWYQRRAKKRRTENDPNAGNIASVIYAGILSAGQLSAGNSTGEAGFLPSSQPVRLVVDIHHMGVMEQPVQQCGGQDIVTEQFPPRTEIFIAGQDDAAMLIPFRDQTEQQFRLLVVQLHISNLVNHQHGRAQIDPPPALQPPLQLRPFQIRNEVREGGVINHHTDVQLLSARPTAGRVFS